MSEVLELSSEKLELLNDLDRDHKTFTYGRVHLQTEATNFYPNEVDTTTRFTRNVKIKRPFASAPMSTVTESEMAIAMAELGGVGVIHMGLSPEAQAEEVRRVKDEVKNLVEDPELFSVDQTIEQVRNIIAENSWHFSSFPVINSDGTFAGMLTEDGIKRTPDSSSKVEDQMKSPDGVLIGEENVTIEEAYSAMINDPRKRSRMVLLDENQMVKAMYLFSDVERVVVGKNRDFNVDRRGRLITAAAIPTSKQGLERLTLMKGILDVAVFDTSDGDSPYAFEYYEKSKSDHSTIDIMSGNIISRKSAQRIAEMGLDGIRTGQGGSPICITREELGTGCGQFTSVYRTALGVIDAVKTHPSETDPDGRSSYDIPVCADGAIKMRGDPSKAIAGLAETVMMGTALAGVTESPGKPITLNNGRIGYRHRGMGSQEEFEENQDAQARYEDEGRDRPQAEGISTTVEYKGDLKVVLKPFIKLLMKSMYQCNARTIDEHRMNTMFNPGDESTEREAAAMTAQ